MKIAVVQMRSGADPWENLFQVNAFVEEARLAGCELACFPENVFFRGPKEGSAFSRRDSYLTLANDALAPNSEFARALAECASSWPLAVSLGSVLELHAKEELPYNAHWIVHPGGRIESYHKMHLFDFHGEKALYSESRDVLRGRAPRVVDVGHFKVGCSVCYDLRFPELYRYLTRKHEAQLLLVPASFTLETGRVHWHTLLRARAIENLAFVAAPAQWGSHLNAKGEKLSCYGHSLVYGPWGDLLAEAPEEGDALLVTELSVDEVIKARGRLPSWKSGAIELSY